MATTSQVLTDPKVQSAWMEVEAATRRYSQAVLEAVVDGPRDVPLFHGRIVDAVLIPGTHLDELTLHLHVERGAAGNPANLGALPVQVSLTSRPTPYPGDDRG